ncbi:tfp pilus assembly protein FimV [Janthinobacterium agaricidamnosum NBRC 102515 = DSM 9628]|uniref:Tfp pilus assembly protein FimV n=2 Tax=Janthinobacterium agaricidamnosum TaxID=55508 RepID=W0VCJ9_9BURK|nr:tfp pilus assembly protein FimV [Janthinobacterium agaricidamnosum NBRC 102515 = DSM 9628]
MPNIPGAAVMTDTLDFVKNLWGSMNVPGMSIPGITAPTLSVEELDKKISDLKAVESWLNLNTSMLRGSIQALEVQRGTIATLKSMGASLAAAIQQPGAGEKTLFESSPYASAFFQHGQAPQAQPEPAPAAPPEPQAAQPAPQTPVPDSPAAQMANPGVWWNLLQDQFKQAVSTAMASDTVAGADKTQTPAKTPATATRKAPAKRAAAAKPKASRAAKP